MCLQILAEVLVSQLIQADARGTWSANFGCQGSIITPLLAMRHGILGKIGAVQMMEAGSKSKTNIHVRNLHCR